MKKKIIKAWAVIHEDHPGELRWYGGEILISEVKKDLVSFVSKKRGGTGDAINPSMILVPVEITLNP